jgi:hypothetical protein
MNATPTETPTYDGPGPQRPTRGARLAHSAEESATSEVAVWKRFTSMLPFMTRVWDWA